MQFQRRAALTAAIGLLLSSSVLAQYPRQTSILSDAFNHPAPIQQTFQLRFLPTRATYDMRTARNVCAVSHHHEVGCRCHGHCPMQCCTRSCRPIYRYYRRPCQSGCCTPSINVFGWLRHMSHVGCGCHCGGHHSCCQEASLPSKNGSPSDDLPRPPKA